MAIRISSVRVRLCKARTRISPVQRLLLQPRQLTPTIIFSTHDFMWAAFHSASPVSIDSGIKLPATDQVTGAGDLSGSLWSVGNGWTNHFFNTIQHLRQRS